MSKDRRENQPKTNYNANKLHMQKVPVKNVASREKVTKND